ncbi:diguanylate cyclase [Castellaniella sp.]|uniref:sensor domain-containing diguanylate cyclase n=1 Tax=Castellaniella sp. TaxID=1955812 RepID=UPI002AFF4D37|nr:diguanylate cyclase [Castellaniella sp.]
MSSQASDHFAPLSDNAVLRQVLDGLGAIIYIKDTEGRLTYANDVLLRRFGCALADILGKKDHHYMDAQAARGFRKNDVLVMQSGQRLTAEESMPDPITGKLRWYRSVKSPLYDAQQRLLGISGVSFEITHEKKTETKAQQHKALLDMVLDNLGACIYMKDQDGRYLYANQRVAETFQRPIQDIVGWRDADILPPDRAESHSAMDRRLFESGQRLEGEESLLDASGRMHHYWTVKVPWTLPQGEQAVIGLTTDITELHELKEQLQTQATTDSLTAVANRRCFYEHAVRDFAGSRRRGHDLSLITLDVDHFKQINDQYGHLVGDAVLRGLARVCADALREEDVFARTGGEEFAVLLPATDLVTALSIAERLRTLIIQGRFCPEHPALEVSASFGVVSREADDAGFDALFSRADDALYQAKKQGRNQVVSMSALT